MRLKCGEVNATESASWQPHWQATVWRRREITFALGQLCPGPILTHYGGSPSHLKTLPALIASTLPRQIPWLLNTLNFTTRNFWRRFTCHIWKETLLQSRLQSLRCSPIQPTVKEINLVTISVQIFCLRWVTASRVHHGESNEVWQWQQNTLPGTLRRWQGQWELLEKASVSEATPHSTRSHTSLPACPCPSPGSPGIPGNHRASSQAGALLNGRALQDRQRWRSLSACTARGWVSAVSSGEVCESQVALAHPAATGLGRGQEHSSWQCLVTGTLFPRPQP